MQKFKTYSRNLKALIYEHLLLVCLFASSLILIVSYFLNIGGYQNLAAVVSNLSTFGILIISILALEIIKTARKDADTRYHRESAQASLIQIERFKKDILPAETLKDIFNVPNFDKKKIKEFTKEELKEIGVDYDQEIEKYLQLKGAETPEERRKVLYRFKNLESIINAINEAEIFSFSVVSGISDGEIMFPVCSDAFCEFVEGNYSHYCDNREKNKLNLYKHTIRLYDIWSAKTKRDELGGQIKMLIQEQDSTPILATRILGEE